MISSEDMGNNHERQRKGSVFKFIREFSGEIGGKGEFLGQWLYFCAKDSVRQKVKRIENTRPLRGIRTKHAVKVFSKEIDAAEQRAVYAVAFHNIVRRGKFDFGSQWRAYNEAVAAGGELDLAQLEKDSEALTAIRASIDELGEDEIGKQIIVDDDSDNPQEFPLYGIVMSVLDQETRKALVVSRDNVYVVKQKPSAKRYIVYAFDQLVDRQNESIVIAYEDNAIGLSDNLEKELKNYGEIELSSERLDDVPKIAKVVQVAEGIILRKKMKKSAAIDTELATIFSTAKESQSNNSSPRNDKTK